MGSVMTTKIKGLDIIRQAEDQLRSQFDLESTALTGMPFYKQLYKTLFGKPTPIQTFWKGIMEGEWVDDTNARKELETLLNTLDTKLLKGKEIDNAYAELLHVKILCKIIFDDHDLKKNLLSELQKSNIDSIGIAIEIKLMELKPMSDKAGIEWDAREFLVPAKGEKRRLGLRGKYLKGVEKLIQCQSGLTEMIRNIAKAFSEHVKKQPHTPYANIKTYDSVDTIMNRIISAKPMRFEHVMYEDQGKRTTMEDALFYLETKDDQTDMVLTGILDGHGGDEVSGYAKKWFETKFAEELKKSQGNVHQAFEVSLNNIQNEIIDLKLKSGSTAVICFIDKKSNLIYTATLGDSEANIYRNIEGQLKSIPLSCVRDWGSKKDAARAAKALGDPSIATSWPQHLDPKQLRFPSASTPIEGAVLLLNVARALGDVSFAGTKEAPGVIQMPKITVFQLETGDTLILACDGLKDYVSEYEIIDQLIKSKPSINLAKTLVDYAINKKESNDNISVLIVSIT